MNIFIKNVLICVSLGLFECCLCFTCPSLSELSQCTCNDAASTITCDSVSENNLDDLIGKVKNSNPSGSLISKLKVTNYLDEEIDITIFSPCFDKYCDESVDIAFTEIDFSDNKNLKYVMDFVGLPKYRNVTVEYVSFRNCSLIIDERTGHYTYFYNALMAIGPQLKTIDLSINNLVSIPASSGFDKGYNWPNLVSLNLSQNIITDIGYQWFFQTPNVDYVDLSNNMIINLWNEAFSMDSPSAQKINTVVTFDLTNNHLSEGSTYYNTIFKNLKRPAKLILATNYFHSLPSSPFASFLVNPKNNIEMKGNKIFCDCDSKWIVVKAVFYKEQVFNYNCINFDNNSVFDVKENICKDA